MMPSMTAKAIRKASLDFTERLEGRCGVDGLIQQSIVAALYEIAAQLAELNDKLKWLEAR